MFERGDVMRGAWVAGSASVLALAAAVPAEGRFESTRAGFTLAYESTYSYSRITEVTPKPGCGAMRGRESRTQVSTAKTKLRVWIERRRSGSGMTFTFFPAQPTGLRSPFPVTLDLRESEHSQLEWTAPNDREFEDPYGETPDRCEQGAFTPRPDEGAGDFRCPIKGTLIFVETRGKVRADFARRHGSEKSCGFGDDDGYPGRTNYLKMVAKASQAALYRKRVNTLKATGRAVEKSSEQDSGSVRTTTDTNQAQWTMKLTRTTPWRPVR